MWWAWNTAAIAAAHDVYQIEHADLEHICAIGGLNATTCANVSKPPPSKSNGHHSRAPPIPWEELCEADATVAWRVYQLATQVGYRYNTSAVSASGGCQRRDA